MKKQHLAIMAVITLLTAANHVSAASAPTSQFGYQGWPYRQPSCRTENTAAGECPSATACPTELPAPTSAPTQAPAVTQTPEYIPEQKPQSTSAVDRPALEPNETATPAPTQCAPTAAPQVTAVPTSIPQTTAAPTARPTAAATAKPTTPPTSAGDDYTTDSIAAQEQIALNLLNEDRIANGRSALTLDSALSALARMKSNDMFANKYFAHTSPTLGSAAQMLQANGYAFNSVGENIAHHATVYKAEAAFMSSSGHRTNILGSQWTKVGIGVCYDANGFVYVTQLFVR